MSIKIIAFAALLSLVLCAQLAFGQSVVATLSAGSGPASVAANPVTNKIYVANRNSNDVTVIDDATGTQSTVLVGSRPYAIAVNTVTNKIYVANRDSNMASPPRNTREKCGRCFAVRLAESFEVEPPCKILCYGFGVFYADNLNFHGPSTAHKPRSHHFAACLARRRWRGIFGVD
jgi:YVTN family beta-propeller protein